MNRQIRAAFFGSGRRLRTIKFLYADNDEDDVALFRLALRRSQIHAQLHVVPQGRSAIEYLSGTGEYVNRSLFPLPDVIFIGWHMPVGSGSEFLSWCRKSVDFVDLPVVVLSGSRLSEFEEAKRLGANVVVQKTANIQELAGHLSDICDLLRVQ